MNRARARSTQEATQEARMIISSIKDFEKTVTLEFTEEDRLPSKVEMETVYTHLKSYTDQYGIPLLPIHSVATELTCCQQPLEHIPNVMEKAKAPIYRALI